MAVWGNLQQSWGDPGPGEFSYDRLVSDIAAWLMRDDLAPVIPSFISLAEADMNRRLRLRAMLTNASLSAAGADLPDDCLAVKSVHLDGYGHLAFASLAENADFTEGWRGGAARWWGVDGNSLVISPTQSGGGTVTVRYYARIPALWSGQQSNAVLLDAPGLYLYGALKQSAPFLGDDARLQTWGALYQEAADLAQSSDDAAEYPGPLVIRSSDHW